MSELKLVAGEDSRVVVNQPWITHEDGYTSVIKGFINSPRFTTSMPYPRAAEGHCLQVYTSFKDHIHCTYSSSYAYKCVLII